MMKRTAIALASIVAVLGAFLSIAATSSDPSSEHKLTGKYALVYSTDAYYGVAQDVRIERLADRAFIVFSPIEARGSEEDCWLPLKSVKRLRVFDQLDEAIAAQQNKPAKYDLGGTGHDQQPAAASAEGVVTLRGKPVADATLRLHADNGLAFAASLQKDGTYLVKQIPPGTYVVTVDGNGVKPKFSSATESPLRVNIEPGKNTLDFSLE